MATHILREPLLETILSQPTAPFREGHVISTLQNELNKNSIPHFLDPIGNMVIGAASHAEYRRIIRKQTPEPLRIYIAHMDHPGFHGVKWTPEGNLEIKWYGGSPTQNLEGAQVGIANASGWLGEGFLKNPKLLSSGRAIETAAVTFAKEAQAQIKKSSPDPTRLFGGFSFRAPVWKEGELLYTKAADDLVGAFSIVSLALDLKKKFKQGQDLPFLGLLTRAEEVGFIGAIGHFNLGWLSQTKRPVLCVSLETSRTLPGAEIGKGPVVRLGDRFTVFDPGALRVFSELALAQLPDQHQRRIMDGGTCEASAATVFGFPSIGISIPLGNYHNQGFEGGPDSTPSQGPSPEFVHLKDISGLIQLCHALLKPKLPWNKPWQKKQREFQRAFQGYRSLLRSVS